MIDTKLGALYVGTYERGFLRVVIIAVARDDARARRCGCRWCSDEALEPCAGRGRPRRSGRGPCCSGSCWPPTARCSTSRPGRPGSCRWARHRDRRGDRPARLGAGARSRAARRTARPGRWGSSSLPVVILLALPPVTLGAYAAGRRDRASRARRSGASARHRLGPDRLRRHRGLADHEGGPGGAPGARGRGRDARGVRHRSSPATAPTSSG